ncbi:MAG: hypothetical protein H6672_03665 [Anaerolineaceae bacterium]|nr:hypothetical protein [Anaerolineaceae bacterium]
MTRKKVLQLTVALLGVALIGVMVVGGILWSSFSESGLRLLPQDCNGVPIIISGTLNDSEGNPIPKGRISITHFPPPEDEVATKLYSDSTGNFASHQKMFMFACDFLVFNVTAEGFQDTKVQYSLFDHYPEADISTEKPNLVVVDIVLERES